MSSSTSARLGCGTQPGQLWPRHLGPCWPGRTVRVLSTSSPPTAQCVSSARTRARSCRRRCPLALAAGVGMWGSPRCAPVGSPRCVGPGLGVEGPGFAWPPGCSCACPLDVASRRATARWRVRGAVLVHPPLVCRAVELVPRATAAVFNHASVHAFSHVGGYEKCPPRRGSVRPWALASDKASGSC